MLDKSLVFVGFDSMDIELTEQWAAAGLLPNFAKFVKAALNFKIEYAFGFEAGSAWPTITTGVPVTVHGQFDGMQKFDSGLYKKRLLKSEEFVVDPFWVHASRQGKKVAVIDVPYTTLTPGLNGLQVVDWLAHVRSDEGTVTYPKDLAKEIIKNYGDNPFPTEFNCPTNFLKLDTIDDIRDFIKTLAKRIEVKTTMSLDFLKRESWDMFMTVFHDAHDVGHMLWHLHDPSHERHDPAIAEAVGDPLLDIYRRLDTALGEVLEALPNDAAVFVFCSHGIRAERSATDFLDVILRRLQDAYSNTNSAGPAAKAPDRDQGVTTPLFALYRRIIPASLRATLRRTALMRRRYRVAAANARRSRPFFELGANHATGGVRINLRGRESAGVVAPGPEYDMLCERLIADLSDIKNAETGESLVTAAVRTSTVHTGPMAHLFPDILVEWNHNAPIRVASSPLIGDVHNPINRTRTGDHLLKHGALFVSGQGVQPVGNAHAVSATDVAPTMAVLLGLDCAPYAGQAFLTSPKTTQAACSG